MEEFCLWSRTLEMGLLREIELRPVGSDVHPWACVMGRLDWEISCVDEVCCRFCETGVGWIDIDSS